MDWANVTGYVAAALLGAVALLAAEVLLAIWYLRSGPPQKDDTPKDVAGQQKYKLPQTCKDASSAKPPSLGEPEVGGGCGGAVSLALQFLFQQLRHEAKVRRWLHRKLSTELAELLTRSTPGRLFESLTLRDLDLGTEFVEVNSLVLENADFEQCGERLRGLDFRLDVAYEGSFRLDIDAAMLLGKTARISITVSHIKGGVRLRFSRDPYTHWALAFIGSPDINLAVSGSFQGRQLRPRLAHLITAQIKRAIARRHTLPNYKIRYKPFFVKVDPGQMEIIPDDAKSVKPKGNFQVTVVEVTRLHTDALRPDVTRVYCTVALDSYNWVSCRDVDASSCMLTLDIVIAKTNNRTLGIVFKQTMAYEKSAKNLINKVVIETVLPLSAAYKADLRRNDVIVAVDGKKVNNMNHVAKLIKGISASQHSFVVRVERTIKKSSTAKKIDCQQDSETGGNQTDDNRTLLDVTDAKRSKGNSFSFRRVSEVMEGVGIQRLRGSPSKSDIQDTESKSANSASLTTAPSSSTTATEETSFTIKSSKGSDGTSSGKQASPAISFTRHSDTIQIPFVSFGLRKRRCSVENKTSSDSSTGSTPTASGPNTPLRKANSKDSNTPKDPACREVRACSVESIQLSESSTVPKISHVRSAEDLTSDRTDLQNGRFKTQFQDNPKMTVQSEEDMDSSRAAYEYIEILQIHNTRIASLESIVELNDTQRFRLCENHKYLNINVWAKVGDDDDILLGYVNIPLVTILSECQNSKLGHHIKQYSLLPPDVSLTINKNHPLSSHSGFEPCLCYGDILLSFVWTDASAQIKDSSKDSEAMTGSQETLLTDTSDSMSTDNQRELPDGMTIVDGRKHDFLRTHFHRSTQCDFCSKKIWLKDAVQCRNCAMCCHKKCVQKCQTTTVCMPSQDNMTANLKDECTSPSDGQLPSSQPEILIAQHFDGPDDGPDGQGTQSGDELDSKDGLDISQDEGLGASSGGMGGLLAAVGGSLRRVGSAHSLAPLRSSSRSPAPPRSLPPSPCHTPRKQSLASPTSSPNPFEVLPSLLEETSSSESFGESLDYLLAPIIQSDIQPDALLALARDTGKLLFTSLATEERTKKILDLMAEVRESLAAQSSEQAELSMALSSAQLGAKERSEAASRMLRCEGRGRALTALMLYCCSAAQSAAVAAAD